MEKRSCLVHSLYSLNSSASTSKFFDNKPNVNSIRNTNGFVLASSGFFGFIVRFKYDELSSIDYCFSVY